jgi:SAM-dependent methyltransferase
MRLEDIFRHLKSSADKDLLEVGCAYGYFLELAQRYFRRTIGIDVAEDAASSARIELGVDARSGDFLSDKMPWRPDAICFWDTVEHLRTPASFIARAADLLRPGGYLFLTTGDIGSLNARIRRERWRLIHPPTHLHYFTEQSISILLRNSGFAVEEVSHPGFYRSITNTVANLSRATTTQDNSVAKRLSSLFGSYYLNLFDIMFVAARKIA